METSTAACLLVMSLGLAVTSTAHADHSTRMARELTASSQRPPQHAIDDVIIHEGGVVRGRCIDEEGTHIDGARIVIRQNDRIAATVITDARGEFTVEGLSSGVYRMESPSASGDYRLWQASAAPPAARPVALVVSQNPTLRGQYMYRNMDLVTLGLGAAGVTLGVLALDRADDAEARANRLQSELDELRPASP
jgi:hypothetical protein